MSSSRLLTSTRPHRSPQLQALGLHVSALAGSLAAVLTSREAAIVQGPTFPPTELARLAQLTTEVSRQLATLPATFTLTSQRLLRLESLVALDQIAALASELETLREQYAAARLEAKQTVVERIRAEAWDEVDARESAWRRCEERIAAENPALNAGEVRRAVEAAFEGASDRKVADLDVRRSLTIRFLTVHLFLGCNCSDTGDTRDRSRVTPDGSRRKTLPPNWLRYSMTMPLLSARRSQSRKTCQ